MSSPRRGIEEFYIEHPSKYTPEKIDSIKHPFIKKDDKLLIKIRIEREIGIKRIQRQRHVTRKVAIRIAREKAEKRATREIITRRQKRVLVHRDKRGRFVKAR